jgi:hypothetical protein
MRALVVSAVAAAACVVPGAVSAQATNYKGIGGDDLKRYCVYNDKLYSVGAGFCSERNVSISCESGSQGTAWKSSTDTRCELNPSKTPE